MSMLSNVTPTQKVYEVKLLKDKVKFRPFTVKEEKNILIAMQDNTDNQMLQLKETLKYCTFGKVDIDNLTVAEIEMLFVSIRNKSLGETMDVVSSCKKCDAKNKKTLNLENIELFEPPKVAPEIQLDGNLWVVMRYPNFEASYKMMEKQSDDAVIEMIASSLVSVISDDEQIDCANEKLSDKIDFVEKLTHSQLEQINAFLQSAPTIKFTDSYVCKSCGETNEITLEGLQNFFG